MPRDMCPHYPEVPGAPTTRCRACGVQISTSTTSEGQPRAAYPGTAPAAGTAMSTALKGGAKVDGKQH